MRYVIDARYAGPRPSGIGEYVRALGKRLPALAPDAELGFWIRPGTDHFASGARVSYETVRSAPAGLGTLFATRLLGRLDAGDVFHGPANILGFGLPCPAIVTVHDVMWLDHVAWCQPRPLLRPISGRYYATGIYRALRHAAKILTVSHASADAILRLVPEAKSKIVVTHNACEPVFRPPASLSEAQALAAESLGFDEPYFLVVGQNQPSKAHHVALRAFAAVAGQQPSHRLVLVQRLERGRGLHRLAQELGIAERVKFVAGLSQPQLLALFHAATALLQPSLAEGFGLPALEAMACGCPVIASDIPPLREVLGQAGTFAAPLDSVGFAAAMQRLVADTSRRSELRAAGLEQATRFSWDKTAALTWDVYRDVARAGR
jgi:glycosyltransferase involved in cell wall biosynthesis